MISPKTKGFDPGHAAANGYTKADWDEVSDNPEWTERDFAEARPFARAFPDLDASIEKGRKAPAPDDPRRETSLRLDPDVIAKFKATGKGWEARINEILRKAEV